MLAETIMTPRHSLLPAICFCLLVATLISCGGSSGSSPQAPVADFIISLSPGVISQQAGGASSPFNVAIGSKNGFSGSVTVALSGLPTGITTLPASPFAVAAGSSQTVTLQIPATVAAGDFQVTLNGT